MARTTKEQYENSIKQNPHKWIPPPDQKYNTRRVVHGFIFEGKMETEFSGPQECRYLDSLNPKDIFDWISAQGDNPEMIISIVEFKDKTKMLAVKSGENRDFIGNGTCLVRDSYGNYHAWSKERLFRIINK